MGKQKSGKILTPFIYFLKNKTVGMIWNIVLEQSIYREFRASCTQTGLLKQNIQKKNYNKKNLRYNKHIFWKNKKSVSIIFYKMFQKATYFKIN